MLVMQSRSRFAWRKETGCSGSSQVARWHAAGPTRNPAPTWPHRPADCHKPSARRRSALFKWLAAQQPKELLEGFCLEPRQAEHIALSSNGLMIFLRLADIAWVAAVNQGVELHIGQRTCLLRVTLTAVAAKLPTDRFLRLNGSTLVNIAHIRELHPASQGGYDMVLRNGTRLNRHTDGAAHRIPAFDLKPDAESKIAGRKPKLSRWDE